jgi:thioredoxin-related protein
MKKVFGVLLVLGFLSFSYALGLQSVAKEALKKHKLILLSVERQDCHFCKKMTKEIFAQEKYQNAISKQYIHKTIIAGKNIKFPSNLKVQYFPTNFILNPKDLSVVDEFDGYIGAKDFLDLLQIEYDQEMQSK